MKKAREEDILVSPDQIPQARELSVSETSTIINHVQEKQQKVLKLKDLGSMDWHKQTTI